MITLFFIEMLGAFLVRQDKRITSRFRSQKTAALLAYLAFYKGRMHSREVLADMLWPESTPAAGRASLSVALSSLRRQFETEGIPGNSVLIADTHNIGLEGGVETDVHRFEHFLDSAALQTDAEQRAALLTRAVSLHNGATLLPGFYDNWIAVEQERLLHRLIDGLAELAAYYESRGMKREAVRLARRALDLDPLREDIFALLERLDSGPSVGNEPEKAPGGKRRQKETVTSVSERTSRNDSPPNYSPAFPPAAPLTRLFGRDQEREQLTRVLLQGDRRLVTLTGPGGVGKTRLTLTVIDELRRRTPETVVFFVPLANLPEVHLLAPAVRTAIAGGKTVAGTNAELPGDIGDIVALLSQASAGSVLLVLDNFESFVDTGAEFVETLLQHVLHLTCLVTSRRRLPTEGEYEFPVLPLPVPATPLTAGAISAHDLVADWPSVALFVDRARLALPDFALTVKNASVIAALVGRLEGIPLAIELAAARAQVFTPSQMLAQMERRLDFLVNRRQSSKGVRHSSMRITVEWSLALLSPESRRFFADLSVFVRGCTVESAREVIGEVTTADRLADLTDASLLRSVPDRFTHSHSDVSGMRFLMLETLREYAAELLDRETPGDKETLKRRHAMYFLGGAREAAPHLTGPEQGEWLDRLDADHDNLRAALAWALAEEHEGESGEERSRLALEMTVLLHRFWLVRGYLSEGRHWLRVALEHRLKGKDTVEGDIQVAAALNCAGILAMTQGDDTEAETNYKQCLELRRYLGDKRGVAVVLNNLAVVESERGRFDLASERYEESLVLWRTLGDERAQATILANLGAIASDRNEFVLAGKLLTESLELMRRVGDVRAVAIGLRNLGEVAYQRDEYVEARRLLEESLHLLHDLGDPRGVAFSVIDLGLVVLAQGDRTYGEYLVRTALECCREIGAVLSKYLGRELENTGLLLSMPLQKAIPDHTESASAGACRRLDRLVTELLFGQQEEEGPAGMRPPNPTPAPISRQNTPP